MITGVVREVVVIATLLLTGAALTACASRAQVAAHSDRSAASRPFADADTPEAAAIGFDKSIRGDGELKFECIPGRELSWYGGSVGGRPSASVRRGGARWVVTLTYGSDELNRTRYQVRSRDGGYCVSAILPNPRPKIGPSSPVPYSGSASTSPPR